jgi:sortase A
MTLLACHTWLRRIELLAFSLAFLCACYYVYAFTTSRIADVSAAQFGKAGTGVQGTSSPELKGQALILDRKNSNSASATVIGRLEIPRLALTVPIMSDFQSASLLRGVGHIPGTAMPGGLGTLGLAGHRDTYFRPLRGIKPNMDIRVTNSDGTYHYLVDSTEVVTPEDVRVLDIQSRPELTLITCYPFYYVGAAPRRFIVHAHLVSALPDPVTR